MIFEASAGKKGKEYRRRNSKSCLEIDEGITGKRNDPGEYADFNSTADRQEKRGEKRGEFTKLTPSSYSNGGRTSALQSSSFTTNLKKKEEGGGKGSL